MTDSQTELPTKRTSRLRPTPETEAQEPPVPTSQTSDSTGAGGLPAIPEPEPALAPAADQPEPTPAPEPAHSPEMASPVAAPLPSPPVTHPPAPLPEQPLEHSPFRKHDVVQVLDLNSRHYGQFFMVGDVLRGKVHGYYLTPGRHVEYVTVEQAYCWFIGSSKVRSPLPCSPKWISDNRPPA